MVNKFKVGDIIIANKSANGRYLITTEGWKGKVLDASRDNCIEAIGVESGASYILDSEYFDLVKSVNQTIVIYPNSKNLNETIAILKEGKTVVKTAKSVCNPTDTYDFKIGADWAVKRLLETEEKPITYREVKRNAKVGEYVKITNIVDEEDCYKAGGIYCVDEINSSGVYFKTDKTHLCCKGKRKGHSYAYNHEYVVLEGYQPILESVCKNAQDIVLSSVTNEQLIKELERRLM